HRVWRLAQRDANFGGREGQALADANVKRHTFPAPRVDMHAHCREGLHLRVRGNARFARVVLRLAAHPCPPRERANCTQYFRALVTQRFVIRADRRLHGQVGDDLQHVVLHDVANGAHFLVKGTSAFDTHFFRHRDLYAVDDRWVPERFEERVGEPEIEEVLHRLLAEIVVDAEDGVFREHAVQRARERHRRSEIPPKWFFHDEAAARAADRTQPLHDGSEHAGRYGHVQQRLPRRSELRTQSIERGLVAVIAFDEAKVARELRERAPIEAAKLLQAVADPRAPSAQVPARTADADDRHVELAVLDERLQRRVDLAMHQVAG